VTRQALTQGTRSQVETTPMDKQRKGVIISGLVLAAMALGIYLVVILKFMR
jgi:hypothetical protein